MSRRIFQYSEPERCVVGTVGLPGERQFFIQVREGNQLTSVAIEKAQAQVLADRLDALLDEARNQARGAIAGRGETPVDDSSPLDAPIEEEFRVGAMALGWDEGSERVVIEAHEASDDPVAEIGDDGPGPDTLRIWLNPNQGRQFAERARRVVAAGRPPCMLCGQPLDPGGHICPRSNGFRRRDV
jgi:uncharacterized repeat protein (TIGR03847 family)